MGGGTGNLRTLRNQSGTVGSRTLGSILAAGNGCGAGSTRRVYAYFKKQQTNDAVFYENMFKLKYGRFPMLLRSPPNEIPNPPNPPSIVGPPPPFIPPPNVRV